MARMFKKKKGGGAVGTCNFIEKASRVSNKKNYILLFNFEEQQKSIEKTKPKKNKE